MPVILINRISKKHLKSPSPIKIHHNHAYSTQPAALSSIISDTVSYPPPIPDKPSPLAHLTDHTYSSNPPDFTLQQQYADDTSWASTSNAMIQNVLENVPDKLSKYQRIPLPSG